MALAIMCVASLLSPTRRALSRYRVSGYPGNGEGVTGVVGVIGDVGETGLEAQEVSGGKADGGQKTKSVRPLRTALYVCDFCWRLMYRSGSKDCGRGSGCCDESIFS